MEICNLVATAALLSWPVIPIFWVPVHILSLKGRRPGILPYIWSALVYAPIAWMLLSKKGILLGYGVSMPWILVVLGWLLLFIGLGLHAWTILMLRRRIVGIPEVMKGPQRGLLQVALFDTPGIPHILPTILFFGGPGSSLGDMESSQLRCWILCLPTAS